MKKIINKLVIILILILILNSCFNSNTAKDYSKITFYLTDSPNTDIAKAEILVKEIEFSSDSTNIILLENKEVDFLSLAGVLSELKNIKVIDENIFKNSKIMITLDSTIDLGNKEITSDSTEIELELSSNFNIGRDYNVIIDLDLATSLSNDKFNPNFRTWMVADTTADYRTITGYVYDNEENKNPKVYRPVAIITKDSSELLYSTLTNKDGKFIFNKIKLPLKDLEIAVLYSGVTIESTDISSYVITDSATKLGPSIENINLYIGDM
ncbi:DUF4382 domain-containing protein [Marinitoga sp. 38H-ov]|uniref:DUF4382 domain-containing protein n=1 Tax=Marinitoga sp. 38H-ov TaxID=1755814 RepID=UPI0013EAF5CE|nr:DUF4382 domain-containing protein [Marinitoga sp. 38H-ov]KAF2955181.1 hypothetical protein AS160_01390 [Marinitoga sp. 38H-ov]